MNKLLRTCLDKEVTIVAADVLAPPPVAPFTNMV